MQSRNRDALHGQMQHVGRQLTADGCMSVVVQGNLHMVLHDDADKLWGSSDAGIVGVDQIAGIDAQVVLPPVRDLGLHASLRLRSRDLLLHTGRSGRLVCLVWLAPLLSGAVRIAQVSTA